MKSMVKRLCGEQPRQWHRYINPLLFAYREVPQDMIADMIKMGVIRGSSSPYASPVVVVKKKDDTNLVCDDYRKLNKITVFDPGPIPTKLQFQGGSHQRIRECWSGLS